MRKYATLPVDCTALKVEVNTLIKDRMMASNPFIWFGSPNYWSEIKPKLPSLDSTFSLLSQQSTGVGRLRIYPKGNNLPFAFSTSFAIVPLGDEPCNIAFFEPNPGAQKVSEYFYELTDCTEVETVSLDGPILVGPNVVYRITTVDPEQQASVISVRFSESDIDNLLAEDLVP